jgi:hypothetical protein
MAQQKAVEAPIDDVEDLVDELQPGTKLLKGQYTIVRYLNSGGFGITYLAKDSLDRDVVIKECFPSSFCRRSKAMVTARSRAHSAELRSVVQLFVREARNLSKIVHPNIVAVHQVFEDNGTAYMAIDFIDGLDLQQIIDGQGRMPRTDEIVLMTEKLLAAVGFIHARDMLHRDIAPDNVLVNQKGDPVLIDFGAARERASQTNRAMSALRVVKDGYSPQEFYIAGSEQGPWSDLYALGATLYHLISGEAPANGQARLAALAEDQPDPYVPLTGRFAGFPAGYLEAIDKAMQTLPKQRLQSAQEWMSMFRSGVSLPLEGGDDLDIAVRAMVAGSRQAADDTATPLSVAAAASEVTQPGIRPVSAKPASEVQVAPPTVQPRIAGRSGMPVQLVGGAALALLVLGGAYVFLAGPAPRPGTGDIAPATAEAGAAAVTPAADAGTEPAPVVATAETASGTAEAPAEQAPAETAVVAPDPAPAEPAPVEEEAVAEAAPPAEAEPAATETAAATEAPAQPEPVAPAETAPADDTSAASATPAVPSANQISFAAWDVKLPFVEDTRIIGGERKSIILRVLPGIDPAISGDWLANGLILHKVNGTDIQLSGSVITSVLNAMSVDPDGKARVLVEYAGSSLEPQTGLLTVDASRIVSLANGLNVRFEAVDAKWQAVVTGVIDTSVTDLRQGDILFRDKTTEVALNAPGTLEAIMQELVAQKVSTTEFSIIRDNKLASAFLRLAPEN